MAVEMLVTNVRSLGGDAVDIHIVDGKIVSLDRGVTPAHGATVIDGGGRLVFPGFVDAHTHMDKTLLGLGWYRNEVGPSLTDKIENERRLRREQGIDSYQQSSRHARIAVATGTTPELTVADNVRTIALIEAGYLSIRENRPVRLAEIPL